MLPKLNARAQLWLGKWDHVMTGALVVLLLALAFPSAPLPSRSAAPNPPWVDLVEQQGRFINTGLQVALPLITRDIFALRSLIWVAVVGTTSTHGLKHALNDVEVRGVRLGQRPHSENSRHNNPSGHSSMASSAAVFVGRRYSWNWLWLLVPLTLATMYARIALDAHTLSATIVGAALGVLFTWPFCPRRSV